MGSAIECNAVENWILAVDAFTSLKDESEEFARKSKKRRYNANDDGDGDVEYLPFVLKHDALVESDLLLVNLLQVSERSEN